MNAERLLEHYEKIAEAPDAIPKLRRFILDLAVRGKLVPQDPNDEPAEELLKRIEAEKKRLASEASSRRQKQPSTSEPAPFSVRSNWSWTTLSEVGFLNPRNDAGDKTLASFVPMTLIAAEYGQPNQHEIRPWSEIKKGYTHFAEGDVGLAKITPCFENGKSTVFRKLTGGIGAGTTELHIVRPILIDPQYILIFLKSPHFIDRGIPRMTGTAGQKRVPTEYFASAPFPLPPLAEQQRIVAKVDELMGICDRLERARKEREAIRDGFTTSALGRLSVADETTFRSDASFAIEHLRELTTRPDQIKQLRQTILNLAVRGKLVPQDPNDEPASELLKRIRDAMAERKQKTGDPRIKAINITKNVVIPFSLPKGWSVECFNNLFLFIDYRGNTPAKVKRGIPLITAKNIRMGFLKQDPHEYISEATYKMWMTRGFPRPGDLFFTTEAPLANVCINELEIPFALAQRTICLQPYGPLETKFLMFAIMSDAMQEMIHANATGMTAKGIKSATLKPLPIPIPPLLEQRRIIAKVNEFIEVFEYFEHALDESFLIRREVTEALMIRR